MCGEEEDGEGMETGMEADSIVLGGALKDEVEVVFNVWGVVAAPSLG